jgi:DNA repair protein RadC
MDDTPLSTVLFGPRERLRDEGVERLSDAELVALVLGTGTAREPVAVLATRLLDEARGLHALARLGIGALATRSGIGEGKAARIVAAIELGRRAARATDRGDRITTSRDVFERVAARIADAEVEHFLALPLDARMRVLSVVAIARGSVSACPVAPADAFRAVLREAAAAVVFAHNHPSGDPDPSAEDLALTDRLVAAGELLGVKVLDHVIVARERYFSFLDAGLLRNAK